MTIWRPGDPKEPEARRKPVYTRSGYEIPQIQDSPDLDKQLPVVPVWKQANAARMWLYETENIEKDGLMVRSISDYLYDCVGMVFASRRIYTDIGSGDILTDT